MNSPLHIKKIEILTRLIKEEALTMQEALILLKDENLDDENTYDYIFNDSSYWTADSMNRVIYFDKDISN